MRGAGFIRDGAQAAIATRAAAAAREGAPVVCVTFHGGGLASPGRVCH
jgi:hypothetical protein